MLNKAESKAIMNVLEVALLIILVLGGVYGFYNLKTGIDISINSLQNADIRIEQKFDNSVYDLERADEDIIEDQKELSAIVSEIQASQSDIKASLARIEESNVWIIRALKEGRP